MKLEHRKINFKRIFNIFMVLAVILALTSCLDLKITEGNGNITKTDRHLSGFNKIKVCCGIEVFVTKDSSENVTVETDDNIQQYVNTEVRDKSLNISTENVIIRHSKIKVFVSAINVEKIHASSGSKVLSNNLLSSQLMEMECSSGADIKINIRAKYVKSHASSGAWIKVSGQTDVQEADASSGSGIDAFDLKSETCKAHASSGSHIKVFASEEIIAEASSGGDIDVSGNPQSKNIHKSSGGSVSLR